MPESFRGAAATPDGVLIAPQRQTYNGGGEMAAHDEAREVVLALAEHEEAMSALYSAYAAEYPQVGDLWTSLARDEHGHGKLLRSLPERTDDLSAFVSNREYSLDEIRADTGRLKNLAAVTPAAGLPLQEAFRVALKLEDSLIESQIFVVHDGDPAEVTAVIDTLREQTEKHQRRLHETFKGLGDKG